MPDASPPTTAVSTIYGQELLAFAGDTITKNIHKKGCYDARTIEFMRQYLNAANDEEKANSQASAIYVDIGANIGNHALPVAQFCEHLYLFEPISAVSSLLKSNLANNAFGNYTLFQVALSDTETEAPIYIRKNNIGASSINKDLMELKGDNLDQQELVQIKTGDAVLSQQDISRVDVMKVDVETHEAEVILGLKQTIQRFQPLIILEWNHPLTIAQFEKLDLFDTVLADYEIAVLGDSHRTENWGDNLLGKLQRAAYRAFSRRRLQFSEFDSSQLYRNIVLYPKTKRSSVLCWQGTAIPEKRLFR